MSMRIFETALKGIIGNIDKIVYHPYRTAHVLHAYIRIRDKALCEAFQTLVYPLVACQLDNHSTYELFWKGNVEIKYAKNTNYLAVSINDGVLAIGDRVRKYERRLRSCKLAGELYPDPAHNQLDPTVKPDVPYYKLREQAAERWKLWAGIEK